MEIYQVNNLDCSIKQNRIKLMKAFMKAFGMKEIPSKEMIGKCSKSIENKYGYKIAIFNTIPKLTLSIGKNGSYSVLNVDSVTEAYMKHCLIVKAYIENGKKAPT